MKTTVFNIRLQCVSPDKRHAWWEANVQVKASCSENAQAFALANVYGADSILECSVSRFPYFTRETQLVCAS